ncbi:MAG: hypothetical protein GTO51_09850 [Candidatus Latescibacteria bacterium]|nr:hypothetical protein [Candidatus Latescibacterota bacterium]NIM66271.1 hypothetical protein [Candidatus Latescibacterota bacterium]NIO02752.1 hypothetical protein [Candidatus Latescibacterota bacterium]NIO29887.1 hypothetical protein [Candidatus Latescibacterota bacterium]NIO57501.1 hypothetical protein [Candidatus Latescibacterota bacterium]
MAACKILRKRSGLISILMCLAVAFSFGQLYAQEECDIPLFLQITGAKGNVLFIFDSSGSMTSIIYHEDYEGRTTYTGTFAEKTDYNVSSPGYYSPADFNTAWDTIPEAYLVPSEKGQSSRYKGNYLNWVYYHATDEQRASIPAITRVEVAKAVFSGIVQENPDIRFGVMKFNNDVGGLLISPVGTPENVIISDVEAITAGGWTPLAETMVDALEYLQTTGANAPIEYYCQKTFVIVLTDGYPTQDLNIPAYIGDYDGDGDDPGTCESIGAEESNSSNCSDYLDDVAAYLFDVDLRSDLEGQQNALTYTVGFGIDMPLLQQAADNGGGLYFTANNAMQLQASLADILGDILGQISAGSSVAVVSAENSEESQLYRAKFVPGTWWGYLEAFELPYSEFSSPVWEAGKLLQDRDPSTRTVLTALDGQLLDFTTANTGTLMPFLNTASSDTASEIITYTRGTDIDGYRNRGNWPLGDIIESSPVIVGPPKDFKLYLDYMDFRAAQSSREPVLYVGANDGMLHCFRASDGYELWAFIPQGNLGKLKNTLDPGYCHKFLMNGTPRIADVHIGGSWKTVLLCGQGQGGDSYFAMDVTDPNSPSLLFDISFPTIFESYATPTIARVPSLDKFVAFISSGPDRVTGEAHLLALDLIDGSVLWSDVLSVSADVNMATSAVAIDLDFDDYDDLLYLNDMAGHLWRIDLTASPFSKSLLFETTQPIQVKPVLTVDEQSRVLVYFGTGRYLDSDDVTDATQQSFYCIIDNHSETTVSKWDLVDQTSTISEIPDNKRGWYMDLVQAQGERVIKTSSLAGGVVYFVSFSPNSANCGSGGLSWLNSVDFLDGSAPDPEQGEENNTTDGRTEYLDEGLGSNPIVDFANEEIVVHLSDTKISTVDAKTDFQRLIVRSWRQLYSQ